MNIIVHSLRRHAHSALLYICVSLLFAYLLVVPSGFPFLGISVCLALLSTLVFFTKQYRSLFVKTLYIFCMLLCGCLLFRAQVFLTFLNLVAIIFFGSVMSVYSHEHSDQLGFLKFFLAPLRAVRGIIKTNTPIILPKESPSALIHMGSQQWTTHGKSLLLSLALLLVIVPLLASANPFFSKWVTDFLRIFDVSHLLDFLQSQNLSLWITRVLLVCLFLLVIPRFIRFTQQGDSIKALTSSSLRNFVIPKVVVAFVLGIFFLSQAQLYLSSTDTLLALGYSHSEYAREVFGQLSLVALIVIALIYNDKNSKIVDRILTYILLLEAFFLSCIALKSVYDYSLTWGLTHKRLWGFTGVIWMFGALSIFISIHLKKLHFSSFAKNIAVLSGVTLLCVNIINFDYLIFHFRKSTTHEGIDYHYLSSLSSDSRAFYEEFSTYEQMEQNKANGITPTTTAGFAARRVSSKINALQDKYEHFDLRTFNFSEFYQYLEVKQIDTKNYDEKWKISLVDNSNHYPPTQTKNSNRFDRFPLRRDLSIIYPLITYYYVTSPSEVAVSISKEQIYNEARLADDIWGQAGINFTIATEPLSISQSVARSVINGGSSELLAMIKPRFPVLPVFVMGANSTSGSTVSIPNTNRSYIVINEKNFTNIDGRSLAQSIGYALGLFTPQAQIDQRLVSGLMGNLGYYDISEPDIVTARERALLYEAKVIN